MNMFNENPMFQEWNSILSQRKTMSRPEGMESASDVLQDAFRIERMQQPRRREILPWAVSFAMACITAFVLVLHFRPQDTTTILASSDTAKSTFTLQDGSKVCLNMGSTLEFKGDLSSSKVRSVRLKGEAYFDVAKDAKRPFVVKSENMDVTVLGTQFTMSVRNDMPASVYLQSGSVAVTAGNGESATLCPDEQFSYNPNTGVCRKSASNAANHTMWAGESLKFNNVPVSDIIVNLNHWYNVDIKCDNIPVAVNTRLSFSVRNESLHEVLDAVCILSGMQWSCSGDNFVIY